MAAKHSLAGQGLAKSVCKATTEEVMAPKKKHVDCEGGLWRVFLGGCRKFFFLGGGGVVEGF